MLFFVRSSKTDGLLWDDLSGLIAHGNRENPQDTNGHSCLHRVLAATRRIVIRPVCVCACVGLLPRQLEIACIDPHETGFVDKSSDHLQLIKFWPSRAPGKWFCGGGVKIFGYALLQPARNVCVSSERFLLRDADRHSAYTGYGNVAGWLGVRHTPVLYQNA